MRQIERGTSTIDSPKHPLFRNPKDSSWQRLRKFLHRRQALLLFLTFTATEIFWSAQSVFSFDQRELRLSGLQVRIVRCYHLVGRYDNLLAKQLWVLCYHLNQLTLIGTSTQAMSLLVPRMRRLWQAPRSSSPLSLWSPQLSWQFRSSRAFPPVNSSFDSFTSTIGTLYIPTRLFDCEWKFRITSDEAHYPSTTFSTWFTSRRKPNETSRYHWAS